MRVKPLLVFFLAATLLSNSPSLSARQKNGDSTWSAVQALQPGTTVTVKDKARKSTRGRLVTVTDLALTLIDKKGTVAVDRQSIAKVVIDNGRSVGRSTLIGAGIGAGAGASVGAVIIAAFGGGEDETGPAVMAVSTALGAVAGTAAGALGGLFRHREVVYESK
ncbi:MAG: hypothetical protein WAU45_01790 [Blastocatellia bacterium]